MLSEKQLNKFIKIYEQQFGQKISREAAFELSIRLLRLIQLINKPLTQADLELLSARRRQLNIEDN